MTDRHTDGRTDICDSRVAFATEKITEKKKFALFAVSFLCILNEYFYFASLLPVLLCSGSIGEGEVAGMAPEEAGVRNG